MEQERQAELMSKRARTREELYASAVAALEGSAVPEPEHANAVTQFTREMDWHKNETEAIRLALAGYSPTEIADRLDLTPKYVRVALKRIMEKTALRAGVDEWRGRELARLERITQRLWPLIDPDDPDATMSMGALDRFLKVSEARRKLLGLDTAVTQNVKVTGNVKVEGEVEHRASYQQIERVERLTSLVDRLMAVGYGSGVDHAADQEAYEGALALERGDDGEGAARVEPAQDSDIEDAVIVLEDIVGPAISTEPTSEPERESTYSLPAVDLEPAPVIPVGWSSPFEGLDDPDDIAEPSDDADSDPPTQGDTDNAL